MMCVVLEGKYMGWYSDLSGIDRVFMRPGIVLLSLICIFSGHPLKP